MPPLQFTPEEVEKSEGTIEIYDRFAFRCMHFRNSPILFSIREISILNAPFLYRNRNTYENLWRRETIGYAYKKLAKLVLVRNLGSKI